MKSVLKYLFFAFCLAVMLSGVEAFAQKSKIDSLSSLFKRDKEDTNKVNHLNDLLKEYYFTGSYDSALYFGNSSLQLAQKINFKKGITKTLGNIGVVYFNQGDYPKALNYYFRALKIKEEFGDKSDETELVNIGNVYLDQGDYTKALDYYFKTLKKDEEEGKKGSIAIALGNIGLVYDYQGDYTKALDYYFKALKKDEELGNKKGVARHLGNIGIVYEEEGKSEKSKDEKEKLHTKALDYYFKALKRKEELGDKNEIAITLGSIGNVYSQQASLYADKAVVSGQLYDKALDYYFRALKISKEFGDKLRIVIWISNIGNIFAETKKYTEAEEYLLDALKTGKKIGVLNEEEQIEESLSQLYTKTNRYQLALDHYKKAMVLKDTLFSADKNKEITRKEMNYEFEKKEAAQKAEQEKQQAVTEAEKKKQQVILYSVVGGLLIVLLFAGFIFRALRITRKQKQIIEEQKKKVEEKQKEILDSIHYARRIQTALLPTEKYIDKTLKRLMKYK